MPMSGCLRTFPATAKMWKHQVSISGSEVRVAAGFFWVVGLILTAFFGFFALWTRNQYDEDLSHTTLFWFSVGGSVLGGLLLLVAVIATGVAVGGGQRQTS